MRIRVSIRLGDSTSLIATGSWFRKTYCSGYVGSAFRTCEAVRVENPTFSACEPVTYDTAPRTIHWWLGLTPFSASVRLTKFAPYRWFVDSSRTERSVGRPPSVGVDRL